MATPGIFTPHWSYESGHGTFVFIAAVFTFLNVILRLLQIIPWNFPLLVSLRT